MDVLFVIVDIALDVLVSYWRGEYRAVQKGSPPRRD